jgi:hypothetical protein
MRRAAICVALAFGLASAVALAQGSGDASRAVATASPAATPAASPAPTLPPAPAATWIVSETRSPIDYSPVAIATASSGGPDGVALQLSIHCRGGRTELVISSPAFARRAEDPAVAYVVNGGQPVAVATGMSASGSGLALKGDVVGFLASLPDQGDIAFWITNRQGAASEGRYALPELKALLVRMAGPCKWPIAAAAPRN